MEKRKIRTYKVKVSVDSATARYLYQIVPGNRVWLPGLFVLLITGDIERFRTRRFNNDLTASDDLKFRFATDGAGNYGYLKADDSFVPFKTGGGGITSGIFPSYSGGAYIVHSDGTYETISKVADVARWECISNPAQSTYIINCTCQRAGYYYSGGSGQGITIPFITHYDVGDRMQLSMRDYSGGGAWCWGATIYLGEADPAVPTAEYAFLGIYNRNDANATMYYDSSGNYIRGTREEVKTWLNGRSNAIIRFNNDAAYQITFTFLKDGYYAAAPTNGWNSTKGEPTYKTAGSTETIGDSGWYYGGQMVYFGENNPVPT